MKVIESGLFIKLTAKYFDDEEKVTVLKQYLVDYPMSGVVIPKSGGIRKLRWPGRGRGKRGGYRVIYYLKSKADEIWLLTMYSKSETANIPPEKLRAMQKEIEE